MKKKAMAEAGKARINGNLIDSEIREWKDWEGGEDPTSDTTNNNNDQEKGGDKEKEMEGVEIQEKGMEDSVHAPTQKPQKPAPATASRKDKAAMTTQQLAEIVAEEAFEDTQMSDIQTPPPSC